MSAATGPRAPAGFIVAGCFTAWFTLAMVMGVVYMQPSLIHAWWEVTLQRGAVGLLAVLGAVATEALWRARPWAFRASMALAVAFGAGVLARFGGASLEELFMTVVIVACTGVVLVPTLAYIKERTEMMWPRASASRVPVPGPAARTSARP